MKAPYPHAKRTINRTYGSLKVIGLVGRKRIPAGQTFLLYAVECLNCGAQSVASITNLQRQHGGCRHCYRDEIREGFSVLLPDGRTLAQIAYANRLKLDTVYHRYIRGWPHDALGRAPLPPGGKRASQGKAGKAA